MTLAGGMDRQPHLEGTFSASRPRAKQDEFAGMEPAMQEVIQGAERRGDHPLRAGLEVRAHIGENVLQGPRGHRGHESRSVPAQECVHVTDASTSAVVVLALEPPRGIWPARLEERGLSQAGLDGMLVRPRARHRVLATAQSLAIPAASAEFQALSGGKHAETCPWADQ